MMVVAGANSSKRIKGYGCESRDHWSQHHEELTWPRPTEHTEPGAGRVFEQDSGRERERAMHNVAQNKTKNKNVALHCIALYCMLLHCIALTLTLYTCAISLTYNFADYSHTC